MTQGTFIISLDCEAKWGMADLLDERLNRMLSNRNIVGTYSKLTSLLDEFEVPATFAFVAFLLLSHKDAIDRLAGFSHAPNSAFDLWVSKYLAQQDGGDFEGWHVDGLIETVTASGRHEIASHGLTHFPLMSLGSTNDVIEREMIESRSVLKSLGHDPTTYIYARNQVHRPDLLKKAGYIGYRSSLTQTKGRPRIMNLLAEFAINSRADHELDSRAALHGNELYEIPAGQFLNFKMGLRKAVPQAVTFMKWRAILDDAAANGKVAHMWFHPHNFLSDPSAWQLLRKILIYASGLRNDGTLRIETQTKFCERRRRNA